MSEERQKQTTILLRFQGKKTVKIEMFPAGQWRRLFRYGQRERWSEGTTLDRRWWQGRYRLRVDGRWISRDGRKYGFFLPGEVWALAGEMFEAAVGGTGKRNNDKGEGYGDEKGNGRDENERPVTDRGKLANNYAGLAQDHRHAEGCNA